MPVSTIIACSHKVFQRLIILIYSCIFPLVKSPSVCSSVGEVSISCSKLKATQMFFFLALAQSKCLPDADSWVGLELFPVSLLPHYNRILRYYQACDQMQINCMYIFLYSSNIPRLCVHSHKTNMTKKTFKNNEN